MKFQILPNWADTAEAFEDVDPPRRERRLYGHSILKTETYSKYSQHIRHIRQLHINIRKLKLTYMA